MFVAFAAFMLLIYGHRLGLPVPPWLGLEGFFRPRKSAGQKSGVRTETIEMILTAQGKWKAALGHYLR